MTDQTTEGLVVLWRGVAAGLGFIWLFGFAVGYQSVWWPIVIGGLSSQAWLYSEILRRR